MKTIRRSGLRAVRVTIGEFLALPAAAADRHNHFGHIVGEPQPLRPGDELAGIMLIKQSFSDKLGRSRHYSVRARGNALHHFYSLRIYEYTAMVVP